MPEISLNILDVAENSTRAGASLVEITVDADTVSDRLTIVIKDNGCGMTREQVSQVTDPFFTSRTTRKVGLGVPFFKYAAESTGGSFSIESRLGEGTEVTAVFVLSHIDRMPLGDITSTIHTLMYTTPKQIFFTDTAMTAQPSPWTPGNFGRFWEMFPLTHQRYPNISKNI